MNARQFADQKAFWLKLQADHERMHPGTISIYPQKNRNMTEALSDRELMAMLDSGLLGPGELVWHVYPDQQFHPEHEWTVMTTKRLSDDDAAQGQTGDDLPYTQTHKDVISHEIAAEAVEQARLERRELERMQDKAFLAASIEPDAEAAKKTYWDKLGDLISPYLPK